MKKIGSTHNFIWFVAVLLLIMLSTAVGVWTLLMERWLIATVSLTTAVIMTLLFLRYLHQLYQHLPPSAPDTKNDVPDVLYEPHHLTSLLASTTDFVGISDASGRVLYLNDAARKLMGLTATEDVSQYHIEAFYPPESLRYLREVVLPVVEAERVWQGESIFQDAHGREVHVSQVVLGYAPQGGQNEYFGTIARDLSERIKVEKTLSQYAARMHALSQIGLKLNSSLDVTHILHDTAVELYELIAYDGLSLLMNDSQPHQFKLLIHKQIDTDDVELVEGIIVSLTRLERHIMKTRQTLIIGDTAVDERWDRSINSSLQIRSWLGIPMIVRDQVVGLLNLSSRQPHFFSDQDVHLMLIFAQQCATALVNAQLFEQVQQELNRRTETEIALRESEIRFRSLFETMTQGVYYRDKHGRVLSANPAAEEILGQTLAEMNRAYETDMPRPVLTADGTPFTPETYPTNIALRTGQIIRNTPMCIYNPRQEAYRWIVLDAIPQFRVGEDKPYQVYAIFRDVTEQKQAKEALEASEEKFRTLFETMSQGVIYRDKHGRVVDTNPALRRIFHLDRQGFQLEYDFHGVQWRILDEWGNPMTFDDLPSSIALRTGQPVLQQLRQYVHPTTGEKRWLMIDAIPQFMPGEEEPYQAYMVINDITLQKQAEEALREAQKLESLGILAGGIAHDFNNLLVALLGQSSLALRKLDEDDPARRHIQKVVQAAEHAASLTRQMLAYSGKGQFEIAHLQLNELIEDNLELLRVAIAKNVQLTTYLAPNLPLIEADISQIQQIVMNLVINAAEAIDPDEQGGTVRIQTSHITIKPTAVSAWKMPNSTLEPGPFVILTVNDNGRGMTSEQLDRIFDPFFTTKNTGRGLGLAAVLGIVRGHKGGLRVDSIRDEGTTFQLAFPVSQTAPSQPTAVEMMPTCDSAGQILVIDDEASVREAVADILQAEGLTVITQNSGQNGLDYYQAHQDEVQLVILDLSMPGLNGYETFAALVSINPKVRVLLSSGYSEMEAIRHFDETQLRPVGFIPKPFDAQRLLTAVQKQL